MTGLRFSVEVLMLFYLGYLLQEGEGKLAIVEPYPKNIFPIEGSSAQVTCIAYDTEKVTKPARIDFMRKNNFGIYRNLSGEPHLTFRTYTEFNGTKLFKTMFINNVTANDDTANGRFECCVFEVGKVAKTATHGFAVTVILKRDFPVLAFRKDVLADPGDKVVLSCNVTHMGTPAVTELKQISWLKGENVLVQKRNPFPEILPISYTIASVKPGDGGIYICNLLVKMYSWKEVNIVGSVSVSVRPSFVGNISNQEVKVEQGKQAAFQCGAVGYPLHVEWKRQKNEKIRCIAGTEDRYSITNEDMNSKYILKIENVTYEDQGEYFCCLPTNCSHGTEGCQKWTLGVGPFQQQKLRAHSRSST